MTTAPEASAKPGVAEWLVEAAAEALHNVEYPTYSPTACRDSNRWSWRGAGDDPNDPKPAMGFLGENGETDHYDEFRVGARAVLAAILPVLDALECPGSGNAVPVPRDFVAGYELATKDLRAALTA